MSRDNNNYDQIDITVVTCTYQLLDLIYWNVHRSRIKYAPDYYGINVETIIIDGGSDQYITDGLKKLEKETAIKNLKVITVPGNKHDSYNLNAATKIAKGKYILKLDSDVLVTERVFWKKIVEALDNNQNALVGSFLTDTWTRGNGNLLGGFCLAWRKNIGFKWDEEYIGYGPSDMDWNMQFISRGYPLICLSEGPYHLGGIMDGLFYAKSEETMKKENQRNHDIFFRKWEDKLLTMKGFL